MSLPLHGKAQLFAIPCIIFPLSYYIRAQKFGAASLKPSFGPKTHRLKSMPFICIGNLESLTPLCLLTHLVFEYTSAP